MSRKATPKIQISTELLEDISSWAGIDDVELCHAIGQAVQGALRAQDEFGEGNSYVQIGNTLVTVTLYEGMVDVRVFELTKKLKLLDTLDPFIEACINLTVDNKKSEERDNEY
jgi:hypothetical protein